MDQRLHQAEENNGCFKRHGSATVSSQGLSQGRARYFTKDVPNLIDTSTVATEIRYLIVSGIVERELLLAVARRFPDLTPAELSEALQAATAQAERRVVRKH